MISFRMTFELMQIEKAPNIRNWKDKHWQEHQQNAVKQKKTVCTSFIASRNQNMFIHPNTSRILALFNCRYDDDSSSSSINFIFRIDGVCWSDDIKSILHWQTHSGCITAHIWKKFTGKNVITERIRIGNFIL